MSDTSESLKATALPKSESEIAAPQSAGASATAAAIAAAEVIGGRRGHYRWMICALLFFATTINYIDRQVLGILATDENFKRITRYDGDPNAPVGLVRFEDRIARVVNSAQWFTGETTDTE